MDYSNLKLGDRQIRLLTLHPPSGPDHGSRPVECTLSVRNEPLPTEPGRSDTHHSAEQAIRFDHWVKSPPPETFAEELRQGLGPVVDRLEKQRASWTGRLADKLTNRVLGTPRVPVVKVAVHKMSDMLSREDKYRVMTRADRSGDRRVQGSGGGFQTSKDATGATLAFTNSSPPVHTGLLPVDDLDPFFRRLEQSESRHMASQLAYLKKVLQPAGYIALSYAWGPPEPTTQIIVNGSAVTVRSNLEAALRRFQSMDYFRMGGKIWIDSLCINQQDMSERDKQVQMMATIYRCAENIIVWLGPAAPGSDLAISYLEHISADYRTEYLEAFDRSDPLTATAWRTMAQVRMETKYEKFRELHLRDSKDADIPLRLQDIALPLYDFFDRPYWRRLWIIQELCSGRAGMPVVCGERVTQWRYIRDGVLRCTSILDMLRELTTESLMRQRDQPMVVGKNHSLLHVAQIAQLEIAGHRQSLPPVRSDMMPILAPTLFEHGPLMGPTLRRAIALASWSECSVAHDRIYGMLSIPGLPDLGIKVDYSKSVVDVYTDFTEACVNHRSLDFLALLDGGHMSLRQDEPGNAQAQTKPSWVPEYGAGPARRIGLIEGEWHAGGYVSVGWSRAKILERCLVCHGKVVDVVDGVGAMSHADVEAGAIKNLTSDDPLARLIQPSRTASKDNSVRAEEVVYDVLVGGCDLNGRHAPPSFKCLYSAFPVNEPSKHSSFYRNWHFLRSSADLLIYGRPLGSYFSHLADNQTTPGEPDEPGPPVPPPSASASSSASSSTTNDQDIHTAAARQAMEARTKMRRLIVTESGLLGLAPVQTQPGDVVVAIAGYGKPVVARKWNTVKVEPEGEDQDQDFWYIIGEAYVHGMMEAQRLSLSADPGHYGETQAVMEQLDLLVFV